MQRLLGLAGVVLALTSACFYVVESGQRSVRVTLGTMLMAGAGSNVLCRSGDRPPSVARSRSAA